ncbi:MAG: S1-like domain-containing RNA-binding protein [Succinivibrio sp.]|nr:S1-like domain-containing RNA-binding protein [Succinivibrio sp.]
MTDEAKIGRMIERPVVEITDQGAYCDCGEYGELFVPRSQLPRYLKEGDELRLFLYKDAGRVLATARHPYLELGMTGRLRVASIDCGTAYLDLGIPKELVVPVSEQRTEFEVGESVLVYVAIDDQGRLFGTQMFNRYLSDVPKDRAFRRFQRVTLVPVNRTPLGWRAVVDDCCYGTMYKDSEKGGVVLGKRSDGYIVNVRPDGRLDVSLQEPGVSGIEHAALELMQILERSNGFFEFSDRTPAQDIEDYLHMSKGKFKKAIGHLYKLRLIEITEDGIRMTAKGHEEIARRTGGDKRAELEQAARDEGKGENN